MHKLEYILLICSILDNRAMDMAQGHGMVLAMHLIKMIKSSRKFVHLMTKTFDNLKNIQCVGYIHDKLSSLGSSQELKPHLFSFLCSGEGSLYERVKLAMSAIDKNPQERNDLAQIR